MSGLGIMNIYILAIIIVKDQGNMNVIIYSIINYSYSNSNMNNYSIITSCDAQYENLNNISVWLT